MIANTDKRVELEASELHEALCALYTEAIDSPEHFGAIHLFHFKPLPGAVLVILLASDNLRGVVAFHLGKHGAVEASADNAAAALDRFIPTYLQSMQDSIEHSEFIEVSSGERITELARAREELKDDSETILLLSFKGYSVPLPPAIYSKAQTALGSEALESLWKAIAEFAMRATAPGPWDQRPENPHHELIATLPLFSLIAGGVLAEMLPLRNTDLPIVWDDVGVEVFRSEDLGVTLLVLYTGDPTAAFAAVHVPDGISRQAQRVLAQKAFEFIADCGVVTGRPDAPTQPSGFVRVTNEEQIRALLTEGLWRYDLNIDLFSAFCPEDRPTDLSFELLAQWALGMNPEMLRGEAEKAPKFDHVRVFRHRVIPLATLIAVTHSQGAATSVAGCYPVEMPEIQWPDPIAMLAADCLVAPKEFEELSVIEGMQQLRRALATLEADGASDEGYPVIGLPSPEIRRALIRAATEQRAIEFEQDLLTFNGIILTWLRGEEAERTRPESFVARHASDPEFLMIGADFSDERGLHSYLVANLGSAVSVKDIIKRLNEADPDDSLDLVLQQAGFEMLDTDEAREAIRSVVERLQDRRANVYHLAPMEPAH